MAETGERQRKDSRRNGHKRTLTDGLADIHSVWHNLAGNFAINVAK